MQWLFDSSGLSKKVLAIISDVFTYGTTAFVKSCLWSKLMYRRMVSATDLLEAEDVSTKQIAKSRRHELSSRERRDDIVPWKPVNHLANLLAADPVASCWDCYSESLPCFSRDTVTQFYMNTVP